MQLKTISMFTSKYKPYICNSKVTPYGSAVFEAKVTCMVILLTIAIRVCIEGRSQCSSCVCVCACVRVCCVCVRGGGEGNSLTYDDVNVHSVLHHYMH